MDSLFSPRKRFALCFGATALFAFICHGYRFLNASFSGDATLISLAGEETYQISLGRFLQPVWWLLRGHIVAPFLIGLFMILFLALSAVILTDIFQLKSVSAVLAVCGILTASETLGIANATYLPWSDVYTVALFFALLGAWCTLKRRRLQLCAPFCYLLSLGLYQSYITCAASVLVIAFLCETCAQKRPLKEIWKSGLFSCVLLAAGLLLYAAVLKLLLSALQIDASTDYNGVGRVGLVSPQAFLALFKEAYLTPLQFLFNPSARAILPWHVSRIPTYLNLIFLIAALVIFFQIPLPVSYRLTGLFLLILLPLASNFVMIISQGVLNGLMIYAWSFLYLLPLILAGLLPRPPLKKWLLRLATILPALLISFNVLSCNQMYIKRDLEYSATHAAFSRILGRTEACDEYQPGVTPVVLVGMLPSSRLSMTRNGFEEISRLQGMRYTYGASYETSEYWYLSMILGAKIHLVSHAERQQIIRTTHVEDTMPRFPEEGSVQMIDGYLFVRF